jgi:hypothetical protein
MVFATSLEDVLAIGVFSGRFVASSRGSVLTVRVINDFRTLITLLLLLEAGVLTV